MKQQHNISFNVTQSVLLMTIVASITKLANRYFELHEQLKSWTHNEKLFQHQFQHYKEVPLSKNHRLELSSLSALTRDGSRGLYRYRSIY